MQYSRLRASDDPKLIADINQLIKHSDLFSIPTETVYGLAGNAYDDKAVLKIYQLKGRPLSNPLITHYSCFEDLSLDVEICEISLKLIEKFCPGPLTLILSQKKNSRISKLVNNNSDFLAVRIPSNNTALKILKAIKTPLAMPSANKFSETSPVLAKHVENSFNKYTNPKIIVDAGQTSLGIESTIVRVHNKKVALLRLGMITSEEISSYLGCDLSKDKEETNYPGSSDKHYSPGYNIRMDAKEITDGEFGLAFKGIPVGSKYDLSKNGDLREAASNLYMLLHNYKKFDCLNLAIGAIPKIGLGKSINDKLIRASQGFKDYEKLQESKSLLANTKKNE